MTLKWQDPSVHGVTKVIVGKPKKFISAHSALRRFYYVTIKFTGPHGEAQMQVYSNTGGPPIAIEIEEDAS